MILVSGGVVGGVGGFLVVCLLLWLFWRRRTQQHKKQVDLLQDQDPDTEHDTNLPQYYQPEPFTLPDPTVASSSVTGDHPETAMASGLRPSVDHRLSQYSITTGEGTALGAARPDTPSQASTYMRKSPAPPSFRPVNIIQHDDAGPSEMSQIEPETIELPPAYTNIRRDLDSGSTPHEPPPAPEADD